MKRKRFNEKGEELQSLSIDLAKKILRDQLHTSIEPICKWAPQALRAMIVVLWSALIAHINGVSLLRSLT